MRPLALSTIPSAVAGPSRRAVRVASTFRLPPIEPPQSYARRKASTNSANTEWVSWIKKASALRVNGRNEQGGKALLFAGLGSYPHTPHSPTPSSLTVWDEASEALLHPDATIGYWPKGMEQFAGNLQGGNASRAWMRGWVEGRTLDELMARPDVTAAFILTSSIAILASEQEHSGSPTLLPNGTSFLAGLGFVGTLTALVAAGRLDLATGVRLAMMWASLPASPPSSNLRAPKYVTTILSARHFHSLSSPSFDIPQYQPFDPEGGEGSDTPAQRRRAMQLILDEVHGMQREWAQHEDGEWAEAGIIYSSKVFGVSGTQCGVWQVIDRLQGLGLANPVMDVPISCPFNTELMRHAEPQFKALLSRCKFRDPPELDSKGEASGPIILDPVTTYPIGDAGPALLQHLTQQLRWHKTLSRLYTPIVPPISSFDTVGRGARGLGIMLRGEIKRRPEGARSIEVKEFGVKEEEQVGSRRAYG